MKDKELLNAYSRLSERQKELIDREIRNKLKLNDDLVNTKPSVCPYCKKKTKMIKKGFKCGKQRYECKECLHRFTYDSHTITSNFKISKEDFYEIIIDTLNLVPIAKTAARLNHPVKTIFYNRHKFLSFLEEYLENENNILEGTVEVDELYLLESSKGQKGIKKARKRGEPSKYRGLSHEQVCIVTSTDRNGHEIFKVVGFGKPTTSSILNILKNRIAEGSILYTDGTFVYDQLVKESKCKQIQFKDYTKQNRVEHINTVNAIHKMIKDIIRKYRGVGTKYLNRYLSLFNFLRRFLDMDDNEKGPLILKEMKWFPISITYKDINKTTLVF